jgi:hypothetical protein
MKAFGGFFGPTSDHCQFAKNGVYLEKYSSGRRSVVDRLLPKQDVVGSSPIARSIPKAALHVRLFCLINSLSDQFPISLNKYVSAARQMLVSE